MPFGSVQDVSPFAADVHEFEAVVTNTTKPVVFIGYTPRGVELVYEMAAEVAGGLERLQERPFLMLYPEPISPLVYPADVVDRMFVAADLGMPQIPGTAVQPGATGPVTIAGAVVQGIAEGLISLVLIQLRNRGAPCTLSVNVGIFDMATALMVQAAPETSLALAAQAEVAQSLDLPTWGLAGATDSKLLDAQAGIESTFAILAQGLAGVNLIHDVGYMDSGMACSAEMLVMGNEVIGMARRFIRGIDVSAQTLAREVIAQVGPGGHFLQEDHTYDNFRHELWQPALLTRQSYDDWKSAGATSMAQRVQGKTIELTESHEVDPLPNNILNALDQLKQSGEAELAQLANQ
jgi:trimethylamine--corrinoid protein Co-methyltransferase